MNMENDVDQNLLMQFSCMGTTDKDELVKQLQSIVGHHLATSTASFYLEMNNWNLQGAVGSYFDASSSLHLPSMSLLRLVAVEEETRVHPGTAFFKQWELENSGSESWPAGCSLVFAGGRLMAAQDRTPVNSVMPGCMAIIRMDMVAPDQPGIYESKWRMVTSYGAFFGDVIWVIVTVADQLLNGLTQQLSSLTALGSPPRSPASTALNPFNNPSQPIPPGSAPTSMDEDGNMLC